MSARKEQEEEEEMPKKEKWPLSETRRNKIWPAGCWTQLGTTVCALCNAGAGLTNHYKPSFLSPSFPPSLLSFLPFSLLPSSFILLFICSFIHSLTYSSLPFCNAILKLPASTENNLRKALLGNALRRQNSYLYSPPLLSILRATGNEVKKKGGLHHLFIAEDMAIL